MRHDSPADSIRVLVSDDTRVHTELLAEVLKRDGHLQVATSVSGSESLTSRASFRDVDVLLISSSLDQQPGRGFEILRGLQSLHTGLRAIMLLDSSKEESILEAFRAGARGVFSKHESVETLSKCVRRVYEGQIWANSQQVSALAQALASSHSIRAVNAQGLNLLSKREIEVVRKVAQGMSNREIAEQLNLSQHTIKNCLFRVFDKLGVSSRVELLFMTLSHQRYVPALQSFLNDQGIAGLHDEPALIACQKAAEQGILIAQLALAQFYSKRRASPDDELLAYMWYSIANDEISHVCKVAAKGLTIDQLIEVEQMIAKNHMKRKAVSGRATNKTSLPARNRHLDLDRRRLAEFDSSPPRPAATSDHGLLAGPAALPKS